MTQQQDEWLDIQTEWQGADTPSELIASLIQRARGYRRRMIRVIVAEVAITVLVGYAALAVLRGAPDRTPWLIWMSVFIAAVWAFALWNRHGTFEPVAATTRAYLDLMIVRCERRLRSVRFILAVLAIHVPVVVWLLLAGDGASGRRISVALMLGGMFTIYFVAALAMRAGARAELATLTVLRAQLKAER
jgi:hypothetical protein